MLVCFSSVCGNVSEPIEYLQHNVLKHKGDQCFSIFRVVFKFSKVPSAKKMNRKKIFFFFFNSSLKD